MRRSLLFAAAAFLAAPLAAQQVTKTFDYKPVDSIQDIRLSLDKIKINQIVFKVSGEVGAGLRRSDERGGRPHRQRRPGAGRRRRRGRDPRRGRQHRGRRLGRHAVGWLAAGERDAAAIKFPFVFRNLAKAKTFTITMEVEPKPGTATPRRRPDGRRLSYGRPLSYGANPGTSRPA